MRELSTSVQLMVISGGPIQANPDHSPESRSAPRGGARAGRADHQVARVLEQQLLQLEDCKKCDLSATHDAIRYMKEYADYAHHPLENIVFKYFLKNLFT